MISWRAFIAGIGLAAMGCAAHAQGVSVQSGDHEGFTRLVTRIGTEREWEITQIDTGVIISFTPDAPQFDISRVFDLINRTRLTAIRSENGLHLDLACACSVTIERYQGRFAVIDISDAPEQSEDLPDPELSAPMPAEASVEIPLFAGRNIAPPLPELTPTSEMHDADVPMSNDTPGINVTEAAIALSEQLARATAAGLLDVTPGMSFAAGDPILPDAPQGHPQTHEAAPAQEMQTPETPPLQMANAFDLLGNTVSERLQVHPAIHCVAPPIRPVSEWPDGMSFANGLGALRLGLYDDRGQLVERRALMLAEFYLVYGFGAEAAFWLDQTDGQHSFHTGLAGFLEHGSNGLLGQFEAREGCSDDLTFWLFLTAPGDDRPAEDVRAQILGTYFALPDTLRDLFGPPLAHNFVNLGDDTAALEIRDTLGRGGRISRDALALLDMDLADAAPQSSVLATTHVSPPAHVSSGNAAAAMAHRLRAQIETRGHANERDLLAAEALILETNPQPDLNGLVHVTALAHALAGNLDPIVRHLSSTMARDTNAAMRIFTDVVDILMDQEETAQLLVLLSSPDFGQFGHFPSAGYRRQVAVYFLDHGLPDLARDIIMASGNDRAPDREILGRAFDRISRDLAALHPTTIPELPATAEAPARTAEEITELLNRSRETRDFIAALLDPSADDTNS